MIHRDIKILVLLFAVILSLTLLVGCGGGNKPESPASSGNGTVSENPSQAFPTGASSAEEPSSSVKTEPFVSPDPTESSISPTSSLPEVIPVSSIETEKEIRMVVGEYLQIAYKVLPENATCTGVEMTIEDEGESFVLTDGTLYAQKQGSAVLTLRSEDGNVTVQISLVAEKYVPVIGVELITGTLRMEMGSEMVLEGRVLPEDATDSAMYWESSNPSVVWVKDGVLRAKNEGSATITVTAGNGAFSDVCQVTVEHTQHIYGDWVVFVQPTCEQIGMRYRECEICRGESYEYEAIDATGHDFGQISVKTPATKEKNSSGSHSCQTCGKTETVVVRYTEGEKAHGTLGKNIDFSLYDDGTMYVKGSGVMYDWSGTDNPVAALKGIDKIILCQGITGISDATFRSISTLKEVELPQSLTLIGARAFYECTALKKVNIPEKVRLIGDGAFYSCISLADVRLPDGLEGLGNSTFDNCRAITAIVLPESIKTVGARCFHNCTSLKEVTVRSLSLTAISVEMFADCMVLERFAIPQGVRMVGTSAFAGCTALSALAIPSTVETVGAGAFSGCARLTTVELPASLTAIGENAFADCAGIEQIILPSSVRTVDAGVFSGCTALRTVAMENCPLVTLSEGVFRNCTALEEISLPGSLKIVGKDCFAGCSALNKVNCSLTGAQFTETVVVAEGNQHLFDVLNRETTN